MSVVYGSICDISEIHITVYLEHVRTFREDRLPFATWIKSESWINCHPFVFCTSFTSKGEADRANDAIQVGILATSRVSDLTGKFTITKAGGFLNSLVGGESCSLSL